MATSPLGGASLPFNIPSNLAQVHATDAEFWRLHAHWRALEDDFEADPRFPDEDPESAAMLERAEEARKAMFLRPVWTATALAMKLAACRDGDASCLIDMELQPGLSVLDMIERDCERLAAGELGRAN